MRSAVPAVSRSRPTSTRRGRAEIANIRTVLYSMLSAEHPMTVRQVFYRAVSAGIIAKTEAEYKQTIVRLLGDMRRNREIPFAWIADSTRWMRKPDTYAGIGDFLQQSATLYRKSLWADADAYVEVWLEKEALAGVVVEETSQWDVPLMVTRGYPSLSFLHSAALTIASKDVPTFLYYIGDHDPSGLDIPRVVEEGIREMAPDAEVYFERIAVTPRQIREYELPTRPTKTTDTRSNTFEGRSVEVDAIPSSELRHIVARAIVQHLDIDELGRLETIEQAERETLDNLAAAWGAA